MQASTDVRNAGLGARVEAKVTRPSMYAFVNRDIKTAAKVVSITRRKRP